MTKDPRIGSRLGRYQLRARLGQGGMGQVYQAWDEANDRDVALKILPDVLRDDPAAVRRLLREARAAAAVVHPNVVTVFEVGEAGGDAFVAMELVRGANAQELLRERGALPWQEATRYMLLALRGLEAAHASGIVHRDFKPANLLISATGDVKVADFGLARGAGLTTSSSSATVGTPNYMSPEQCRGDPVTTSADVYAAGATWLTLLTGRPPFVGDSAVQVMFAHCSSPPPDPSQWVPGLPSECAEIVRRAMSKAPSARFQSARALEEALTTLLVSRSEGESMSLRPSGGTRVRPPGITGSTSSPMDRASGMPPETTRRRAGTWPLLVVVLGGIGAWWIETTGTLHGSDDTLEVSTEPRPATTAERPTPPTATKAAGTARTPRGITDSLEPTLVAARLAPGLAGDERGSTSQRPKNTRREQPPLLGGDLRDTDAIQVGGWKEAVPFLTRARPAPGGVRVPVTGRVQAIAASPRGGALAVASAAEALQVMIVQLAVGETTLRLSERELAGKNTQASGTAVRVTGLELSGHGRILAIGTSGSGHGGILVAAPGEFGNKSIRRLLEADICALDLAPNGESLAFATADGAVHVRSTAKQSSQGAPIEVRSAPEHCALAFDNQRPRTLAVSTASGIAHWPTAGGAVRYSATSRSPEVIRYSATGQFMATLTQGKFGPGRLEMWSRAGQHHGMDLDQSPSSLAYAPDGSLIAVGAAGVVQLVNPRRLESLQRLILSSAGSWSPPVAITADGWLAVGGEGSVWLWDISPLATAIRDSAIRDSADRDSAIRDSADRNGSGRDNSSGER